MEIEKDVTGKREGRGELEGDGGGTGGRGNFEGEIERTIKEKGGS